ncbi:MAG TPA: peptidase S8, partial [Flavobacteriaceae bacterium]|nr:peptidase S8 [Flavobacteriaceae bacterium]
PSGNLGVNTIAMPANYPSILAVGGSTIGGNRQSSSNYGPLLDIVAP